jgi:hypothetical protein
LGSKTARRVGLALKLLPQFSFLCYFLGAQLLEGTML